MNVLIIGNGGREHALAWKIKQSNLCSQLFVAPGNAGTSRLAENISIAVDDFVALGIFSIENKVDLVVVGPEDPLVKGIRDYFESNESLNHILMVGPGQAGARLEGSKDFSKQFMLRNNVPTAKSKTFTAQQLTEAFTYVDTFRSPIVLKADGLAAGKGVIICESIPEAKEFLRDMLEGQKFGEASAKVLIEEFLEGIELSVFVLTDGDGYVLLPEAKDYKRIGDNDEGPNTGGMGAVSPVVFADASFMEKVKTNVIEPTLAGLKKENIPYKGFIFIGLMNVAGEPYVIEYNARLGDPETEVVLPRIESDFLELLVACAQGNLKGKTISVSPEYAVTVFMVSGGYPGDFERGKEIHGLSIKTYAQVFLAGAQSVSDKVITAGGRVAAVTGMGATLEKARATAYAGVAAIKWEGATYRTDIALDLQRLENK